VAYFQQKKIFVKDWREFTGDSERDGLLNAMRAVEAREGERRGWDQPPRLYTVHLHDIDSGTVALREVPRVLWRRPGTDNPADDLKILAALQPPPQRDAARMAFADAPDGISAVALMFEGWASPVDEIPDDLKARQAAGERVIHLMPQRQEVRSVHAVDINGYGYLLTRIRGEQIDDKPVLWEPQEMWADADAGPGLLVRAMYCLAAAARTHGWPWKASSPRLSQVQHDE
jgi:hypothetical protein